MTEPTTHDLRDGLRRALAGRFDVERLLGAGGMGSVYLGRDVTLDRPVAIKVIAPELAAAPVLRERFLREARTVARLRHPNIVAVHAAGESDGLLYFVMEFVPGESLRDRLARVGAARTPEAIVAQVRVLRDLARALGYAHGQGVIHRDVKPENVLLRDGDGTGGPTAMLTDFGVAHAFEAADTRMTGTGMVLGSPRYMSPEQASGERSLDGRSDVYSLGLVGYELLAGEPAVTASTAASMLIKHLTETPVPLAERNPHVPPSVAAAIERALAKDPDERWPGAHAFAEALDDALADGIDTVATRAPGRTSGERREAGGGRASTTIGGPPPNTTFTPGRSGGVTAVAPAGAPGGVAERGPTRGRRWRAVAALALAALGAAGAWAAFGRSDGPSAAERRKSYLVAPFEVQSADPQLGWLREASVNMLSLDLAQWTDLKVVDYERGLDLLRDLKLDGARRLGLEDARRLARRAGVWTVVMGQITGSPDSLHVVARLYDVATGKKVDEAQRSAARTADPRTLFDALARDLLDLVGAPSVSVELARSTTSSIEAYRAYLDGVRALNGWQLQRADSLFGRATALDSTFALAYYQRALTMGWSSPGDSAQQRLLARAAAYADRLPPRKRALLAAYTDLTTGLRAQTTGDTLREKPAFLEAQRKYLAVIASDSGDAEAWYGLGDAYYHHRVDGWGQRGTLANWTRALRAFNRTLALDSSFHLAYAHKLDLYSAAAQNNSLIVLDGDSLRLLASEADRAAFGAERVAQAKRTAQLLATREARNWANVDPVPRAYQSLAQAWSAAGRFDSAAAALAEAAARPDMRGGSLAFLRAFMMTHGAPDAAPDALRDALRAAEVRVINGELGSEGWAFMLRGATAAALGGRIADLDSTVAMVARIRPTLPGTDFPVGPYARWWASASKLAMGVPPGTQRARLDSGVAIVDRLAPMLKGPATEQSVPVAYVAYAITRDARFLAAVRRWRGAQAPAWPELDALEALDRGDTAAAAQLARAFPSTDSARTARGPMMAMRWIARAEVQAALGNARAALANYEVLDPARFSENGGIIDAAYPLWVRSYAARGRLHEQLGERDRAIASYERFIALWRGADDALQPQVREAQAAVARLRDAPRGTSVGGAG